MEPIYRKNLIKYESIEVTRKGLTWKWKDKSAVPRWLWTEYQMHHTGNLFVSLLLFFYIYAKMQTDGQKCLTHQCTFPDWDRVGKAGGSDNLYTLHCIAALSSFYTIFIQQRSSLNDGSYSSSFMDLCLLAFFKFLFFVFNFSLHDVVNMKWLHFTKVWLNLHMHNWNTQTAPIGQHYPYTV